MTDTVPPNVKGALENLLPDAEFKNQFQISCEGLLPDLGDRGLIPKLILLHVLPDESKEKDEVVYGVDFMVLALDDYDDNRHKHLEELGRMSAREKKQVVMISVASEAWVSEQRLRKDDEESKYTAAGDDPNRQEAIVIFSESVDRRMATAKTIVTRDDNEKFSAFSDLKIEYSFEAEGKMRTGLLDYFWAGFADQIRKS